MDLSAERPAVARRARLAQCVPMAQSKSERVEQDVRRLDYAIELVEEVLSQKLPSEADTAPQVLKMARDSRLQAADRLVSLLERRAALLGLDAPEQKPGVTEQTGSLAELERKLALVAPGKAS